MAYRTEDDLISTIGLNVKIYRRQQGLTLRALAKVIGMSIAYLSNIEHNKHNLSIRQLVRIAKALDVTVQDLLSP